MDDVSMKDVENAVQTDQMGQQEWKNLLAAEMSGNEEDKDYYDQKGNVFESYLKNQPEANFSDFSKGYDLTAVKSLVTGKEMSDVTKDLNLSSLTKGMAMASVPAKVMEMSKGSAVSELVTDGQSTSVKDEYLDADGLTDKYARMDYTQNASADMQVENGEWQQYIGAVNQVSGGGIKEKLEQAKQQWDQALETGDYSNCPFGGLGERGVRLLSGIAASLGVGKATSDAITASRGEATSEMTQPQADNGLDATENLNEATGAGLDGLSSGAGADISQNPVSGNESDKQEEASSGVPSGTEVPSDDIAPEAGEGGVIGGLTSDQRASAIRETSFYKETRSSMRTAVANGDDKAIESAQTKLEVFEEYMTGQISGNSVSQLSTNREAGIMETASKEDIKEMDKRWSRFSRAYDAAMGYSAETGKSPTDFLRENDAQNDAWGNLMDPLMGDKHTDLSEVADAFDNVTNKKLAEKGYPEAENMYADAGIDDELAPLGGKVNGKMMPLSKSQGKGGPSMSRDARVEMAEGLMPNTKESDEVSLGMEL